MDAATRRFVQFLVVMVSVVCGIVTAGMVQGDGIVVYVLTGAILPTFAIGMGRALSAYYGGRV